MNTKPRGTGSRASDVSDARDAPNGGAQPSSKPWYQRLGPGLLTGVADDDPSGIATYSQGGAQFGPNLLWTLVITLPLMAAVQVVCARIGRANGRGIIEAVKVYYSNRLAQAFVVLILCVNTINVAADLSAMGDAVKLVAGGSSKVYAVAFGIASLLLQTFIKYDLYVRILKWLALVVLAYVANLAFVHIDWRAVAHALVLPHITFDKTYVTTSMAILGTTISPYLFVWQAALEVEETKLHDGEERIKEAPEQAEPQARRIQFDTWSGMAVSNIVGFCIMLTTAATLHVSGVHDIETTAQAASALKPIAGNTAFLLFTLGIVGCGLLAIPALAGSAAYACAEGWRLRRGLQKRPSQAKAFYGVIALSMLLGVGICLLPISPIKALYWTAVLTGLAAVPIMVMVQLLAARRDVAGAMVSPMWLRVLGWAATALMAVAAVGIVASLMM